MSTSWGYTSTTGPHTWGNNFPTANGSRQSPIDINTKQAIHEPILSQKPLSINYDPSHATKLENTGYGFKISMGPGSESTIEGGPLDNKYRLEQFHFHWGNSDLNGSEHTVNKEAFASEVHLVHWNSEKYDSFATAIQKDDGLCVLGTFFKVGKPHPEIQKLIDSFHKITFKGNTVDLDGFDCTTLLPRNQNFWNYAGSLTTPPCNECVIWVVFKEPLEISSDQLNAFRGLNSYGGSDQNPNDEFGGKILQNYRPPCECGPRVVKHSG